MIDDITRLRESNRALKRRLDDAIQSKERETRNLRIKVMHQDETIRFLREALRRKLK